ncbi:MAG: type IV pilus secretin PilQ [Nitrospirae bacterium]|nr:type IV pilus secretin PilQ [Nitrospirota bacterium]
MKRGRHGKVGRVVWVLIVMVWLIGPSVAVVSAAGTGQGTISLKKESSDIGHPVFTLEFRDADLKDVLRALGQENGLNVIIGEEVNGRLTLSFQRVTVHEAFDAILKINNLISFQEGTILRVVKSPFAEGENNMTTEIVPVNFATAKESAETVKTLLSKQGSVAIDARTNSLIVRDLPDNLAKIVSIVKSLDGRTPQVLIEARIVEAGTNFTRELGIQWGGNFTNPTNRGAYQVTGATSNSGGSGASPAPLTGGVGLSGNNFAVNLPATVAQGAGGAVGFTFGNIASTRQLDIQLSAMEDAGQGRILSNPRVMTMDNKEARISSGTEIFVQTAVLSGTSSSGTTSGTTGGTAGTSGTSGVGGVTKIDAKLELIVTPHITPDNRVVMHVRADKKEPDYNRQVQNIPPLTTRTAETDLLVADGETIVIGGIYTRNESVGTKGIPFLSRIPILGWLFKKETKVDNQSELLIFITPTIYKGN